VSVKTSRRRFLGAAAAAGGLTIVPRRLIAGSGETPPSDSVSFAVVGVGGQGRGDIRGLGDLGRVVAVADVDPRSIAETKQLLPDVRTFGDYREMYDKAGRSFEAVLVATPDHWHALPTVEAMQLGKHVYTEKPLARTVWEVRKLVEAARAHDVVTQMGNQGHSFASHRTFTSWVRNGLLGEIREVHTWTTMRLLDSQARIPDLAKRESVPEGLDWDRWVGPAEYHPYSPHFMPNLWRAWTPFGTGSPGDWGCHLLDPVFDAMGLQGPQRITAEVRPGWDPVRDRLAFPTSSRIRFEFDLPGGRTLTVLWHDGEFCDEVERPAALEEGRELGNRAVPGQWSAGAVVYGSKHTLKYGSHGADACRVVPEKAMRQMIRDSADEVKSDPEFWMSGLGSHFEDFVAAIRTGRKSNNPFETAGLVAETAVLGAIALRHPGVRLEWDRDRVRFTNSDAATAMVRPEYREGYALVV
jgi:predicted dehydrogenase